MPNSCSMSACDAQTVSPSVRNSRDTTPSVDSKSSIAAVICLVHRERPTAACDPHRSVAPTSSPSSGLRRRSASEGAVLSEARRAATSAVCKSERRGHGAVADRYTRASGRRAKDLPVKIEIPRPTLGET